MKAMFTKFKSLFLFIAISLFSGGLWAQAPQLVNFQAIARDGSGNLVTNKVIEVRLTILDSANGGNTVYQERQDPTTDSFGYFSIQLNNPNGPNYIDNGSYGTFVNVPWSTGKKWLKIEYEAVVGSSYTLIGTIQLVSVPYSLVSQTALGVNGVTLTGATNGQVLTWNGTAWAPGTVSGNTSYTAGDAISISGGAISVAPGKNNGDVLTWNGSAWVSDPSSGGSSYSAGDGISISGGTISVAPGTSNGQVLTWNGSAWVPSAATSGTTYSAGSGISISGSTISATPYTAGTGISINSNAISVTPGKHNGDVLTWDSAASAWAPGAVAGINSINDFAVITDHESSGTTVPANNKNSWQKRVLNTTESSSGSSISLNNNQITLKPGTYFIDITVPSVGVNSISSRLYDVTNSKTALQGTTALAEVYGSTISVESNTFIKGVITVSSPTAFEVDEYYTAADSGLSYLGVSVTISGQDEIYTHAYIQKLK